MKRSVSMFAIVVLVMTGLALAQQKAMVGSGARVNAGFEKIKSLAGDWEGNHRNGPVRVKYEVVSGGSAVVETMQSQDEPAMITVYHLDGASLMMTHYCGAGNQPRMRANTPAAGSNQISFSFVDATNLASPDAGHMRALLITFQDANHFSQAWTWHEKGQPDKAEEFSFTRVRQDYPPPTK
jgi:hypothetical protein